MSDAFVAFLFGVGVGGWLYSQLARRTGNAVPANNMIGAAVGGLVAAVVLFTLLAYVFHL